MAKFNRSKVANGAVPETADTKTPAGAPPPLKDRLGALKRSEMSLWAYLKALSQEEWRDHVLYIYRIDPNFARRDGEPNYIATLAEPIDEEYLKRTYGGHVLRVICKAGDEKVWDKKVYIEADPIRQMMEVGDPRKATPQGAGAAGAGDSQLLAVMERMFESYKEAMAQGRQFNPQEQLEQALSLQKKGFEAGISGLQSMMARPPSPLEGLMEKMMVRMFERMDDRPAAADPLAQFTQMMSLMRTMREEFATEGGPGASPTVQLVATALEKAPALLDKFIVITQNLATAQGRRPIPVQTTALPDAGGGEPAAAAAAVDPLVQAVQDRGHKELLLRMLLAGDAGDDAALVFDKVAPVFAAQLARQFQADLAGLAADPVLGQAAGHPALPAFAKAFVEYFEGEQEPEAAPATAPN